MSQLKTLVIYISVILVLSTGILYAHLKIQGEQFEDIGINLIGYHFFLFIVFVLVCLVFWLLNKKSTNMEPMFYLFSVMMKIFFSIGLFGKKIIFHEEIIKSIKLGFVLPFLIYLVFEVVVLVNLLRDQKNINK